MTPRHDDSESEESPFPLPPPPRPSAIASSPVATYAEAIAIVEALALEYRAGGDTPRATALEHAMQVLKARQ